MVWPVWWSMWLCPPVWVMCVRADSPEASMKKSRCASDGCGRRHGFMGR